MGHLRLITALGSAVAIWSLTGVAGAAPAPTKVSMKDFAFAPATVTIKAGTTVTFTNIGDIPHDATGMRLGDWTTGALAKGEKNTVTFNKPGTYYYICTPHPWMYGQVIVE